MHVFQSKNLFNPSNAEASFVLSTRTQGFLEKSIQTLSCWYSLDRALAKYSRMSTHMCQGFSHFSGFLHHFVLAKLTTSSIRVKDNQLDVKFNLDHTIIE